MNLNRANRQIDYANAFRESIFGIDAARAGTDIKFNTLQFRAVRVAFRRVVCLQFLICCCTLLDKERNKSAWPGRVYWI